jgi:hypothetical protein
MSTTRTLAYATLTLRTVPRQVNALSRLLLVHILHTNKRHVCSAGLASTRQCGQWRFLDANQAERFFGIEADEHVARLNF